MMGLRPGEQAMDNTFVLPVSEPDDKGIDHFVSVGKAQSPTVKLVIVFANTVSDEYVNATIKKYPGVKVTKLLLDEDLLQFSARVPKTFFVTLFELGKAIPTDFSERINNMFIEQGQRYLVLRPKQGYHGLISLSHVHKYLSMQRVLTLDKNVLEWSEWNQESL